MRKVILSIGLAIFITSVIGFSLSYFHKSKLIVKYDYETLDIPKSSFGTQILGINDHGDVVGRGSESFSGFLYKKGLISTPHAYSSSFNAIHALNNSGMMAGSYGDRLTKLSRAFLYRDEKLTILEHPAARYSYAYGLNDQGDVVGFYADGRGNHGFLYTNDSFFDLDFPGVYDTRATDINTIGQIVGFYVTPKDRRFHGFVYEKGAFTTLDYPGREAFHTRLHGINNRGDIVGFCSCGPNLAAKGFLYQNGIFVDINYPQATETFPEAINSHGVIVGYYNGSGGGHGFYATPRNR